jgi:hypothetical protein
MYYTHILEWFDGKRNVGQGQGWTSQIAVFNRRTALDKRVAMHILTLVRVHCVATTYRVTAVIHSVGHVKCTLGSGKITPKFRLQ